MPRNVNVAISSQLSGTDGKFTVKLTGPAGEEFNRSYSCADCKTVNHVALLATVFAVKCVPDNVNEISLAILTNNRYVISMLERDDNGWLKAANTNADIVASIRESIIKFRDFKIEYQKSTI